MHRIIRQRLLIGINLENICPPLYLFLVYKWALEELDLVVQMDWVQPDAFDEESATRCVMQIL